MYKKPENCEDSFTTSEWKAEISKFAKPIKNRFVPNDMSIEAEKSGLPKIEKNHPPATIILDENKKESKYLLYHRVDQVYHKPLTHVNILLRIRQPKVREENNKPVNFLKTPMEFALFEVMRDCLKQTITERDGY